MSLTEPFPRFGLIHIILIVFSLCLVGFLGTFIGLKFKEKGDKEKLLPIKIAGILNILFWMIYVIVEIVRTGGDILRTIQLHLPLFLCDMFIVFIPLAAFTRFKKFQTELLNFTYVFGFLCCGMGILFSGCLGTSTIYDPILISMMGTHLIPGFIALYLIITKMYGLKKNDIIWVFAIFNAFLLIAYATNLISAFVCNFNYSLQWNYMFLNRGDGTPFDLFSGLVNNDEKILSLNGVLYSLVVCALYNLYIVVFIGIYKLVDLIKAKRKA